MKKMFIFLILLLIPFLVGADDPIFDEIPIAGVDAEDSPIEYGVKVIAFLIYVGILIGMGVYILKSVMGMNSAHNAMMNSRNADGSNDHTKTTGNIMHLIIAVVIFVILLFMWGKIEDEIDAVFDENASMMIEGTDQYTQVELIKRSA